MADGKGYIEEWANPPRAGPGEVASGHNAGPKWISWVLWWPTMLVLKHCESPFLRLMKLMSRLPHSPLADITLDFSAIHFFLAIDYNRGVLASTILRDQGDVAG